jgi:hypothetical protein
MLTAAGREFRDEKHYIAPKKLMPVLDATLKIRYSGERAHAKFRASSLEFHQYTHERRRGLRDSASAASESRV